jgi:hypothetical protein
LHTQVSQKVFQHQCLLLIEISVGLPFQHSQNIDPVFCRFEIDACFARYRVRHHSQAGRRI